MEYVIGLWLVGVVITSLFCVYRIMFDPTWIRGESWGVTILASIMLCVFWFTAIPRILRLVGNLYR